MQCKISRDKSNGGQVHIENKRWNVRSLLKYERKQIEAISNKEWKREKKSNAFFSTPLTEALVSKIRNKWSQRREKDLLSLCWNIVSSDILSFWDTNMEKADSKNKLIYYSKFGKTKPATTCLLLTYK